MTIQNSSITVPVLIDTSIAIFYFCDAGCRSTFLKNDTSGKSFIQDEISKVVESTVCAQCDRLVVRDFHLNLPVCCAAAIRAETRVVDGQVVECPTCQRAACYTVAKGWKRYWKPCDTCQKPTTFERHSESEPQEGEFCQNCGNWSCPDCARRDADNRPICLSCERKAIVRCDQCDNRETIGGEIDEKTLEDEGWYLGPTQTICPDCSQEEVA